MLATKILINYNVSSFLPIQSSMLDVRCSMFIFKSFDMGFILSLVTEGNVSKN